MYWLKLGEAIAWWIGIYLHILVEWGVVLDCRFLLCIEMELALMKINGHAAPIWQIHLPFEAHFGYFCFAWKQYCWSWMVMHACQGEEADFGGKISKLQLTPHHMRHPPHQGRSIFCQCYPTGYLIATILIISIFIWFLSKSHITTVSVGCTSPYTRKYLWLSMMLQSC